MKHEATLDESDGNSTRPRFGLLRLMVLMTLVCILLAVPGGIILFVWLGGWFVVALMVLGALLLLQWPLYFVMKKAAGGDETRYM